MFRSYLFQTFMHGDNQNRRPEVFSREALRLCKGSWRSKIW